MSRNLLKNNAAISTIIIALIVIVIAAAVAGGAYYAMTQNNQNSPSESPTPSASPQATTTAKETPNESSPQTAAPSSTQATTTTPVTTPTTKLTIAGATSLQYSVTLTETLVGQRTYSYTYQGKNLGTTNFMMKIEATDDQGNQSTFIVNGAEQKAWSYHDGEWTNLSATYVTQYGIWHPLWQGYITALNAWNGSGDYTYTESFSTVRIYDITVNPTLSDSLFQHN
jgi:hypothetical protein